MGSRGDFLKKVIVILIIAGMVLGSVAMAVVYCFADEAAQASGEPEITAEAAILYCENTGEIIYAKNAKTVMKPSCNRSCATSRLHT